MTQLRNYLIYIYLYNIYLKDEVIYNVNDEVIYDVVLYDVNG